MNLLILLILKFSPITFAEDKISMTREEFNKAIDEELKKKMEKIGRSKMIPFSHQLLEKEESLSLREKEIAKREGQLKVHEEQLKSKVLEFKAVQEKFIACIDKTNDDERKRIQHMVAVVSGMRPENAANLLSEQNPDISVKILSELDPTKVSKIFNLMDKEVSARLQKQYMTMKK